MTKVLLHSSSLKSIGYDPEHQILEITFTSGETYQHHGVPQSVYNNLIHSNDLGYYLHSHIRNAYPYQKVE